MVDTAIDEVVQMKEDCGSRPEFDCAAGCSQCPVGEASGERQEGMIKGWSFAGAAAGYFLTPLVLAFAGAALGGDSQVNQLIGATVGFGVGMGAGVGLARRRSIDEETAWLRR